MKIFFALIVLALLGGIGFIYSGLYDISATDQHLRPTYYAIQTTMRHSVARRASGITVPPLGAPEQRERGLALYRAHCVQCHGAPGVAPDAFALGLTPLPTPLARSGKDRAPAELFWVIKNGIKMTGMPAWEFRMPDEDIWAITAFLKELPLLSPAAYKARAAQQYGELADTFLKLYPVNSDADAAAMSAQLTNDEISWNMRQFAALQSKKG